MTTTTTPRRPPTRAQLRTRSMSRLKRARHIVQVLIAGAVLFAAVRHQVEKGAGAASVDALCPFGAVETLPTLLTSGNFITKIHQSNIVLGLAVLVATLLVGNTFCGWICPFGALQDGITWVRRTLRLPTWTPSKRVDAVLRYGRYVVLGLVLVMSFTTAKLWFGDYDPYVTLFSLHWIFEPSTELIVALVILVLVVVASVLVERAWCRYLCPLGGVFALLGHVSFLRIRRSEKTCSDCTLCDRPCPVGLDVSKAKPFVSTDCIGCMDCVAACPVKGALDVKAPVFVGSIIGRREDERVSRVKEEAR